MFGFLRKGCSSRRIMAGLSIAPGSMKCIEMETTPPGYTIRRTASVEADAPADAGTSDPRPVLAKMRDALGGQWPARMTVGLASKDVIVRIAEMPPMEKGDARDALRWEFERYFPFPLAEASFDIDPIAGSADHTGEKMLYAVAAVKLGIIQDLLEAMREMGIMNITAVEPLSVALFRAVSGPRPDPNAGIVAVSRSDRMICIVAGHRGNGMVHRVIPVPPGTEPEVALKLASSEVLSTVAYLDDHLKFLESRKLVLEEEPAESGSLSDLVRGATLLDVVVCDPWKTWNIAGSEADNPGWASVIGLAVRDEV